jgi:carboxylesterase type B
VSVHAHLLRGEELFSSAILQSGLLRLCGIMSLDEHQAVYERLLRELGIPLDLEPGARFQRLLAVEEKALTAAMVPTFVVPVVTMPLCDDGVFLPGGMPSAASYQTFDLPAWCTRIILGDARNECIIWNKSWANLAPEPMKPSAGLAAPTAPLVMARMEEILGRDKASALGRLYGISPETSDQCTFRALERLTTHGMYSAPIYFATHGAIKAENNDKTDVWVYHFDVPSHFDNEWAGMAHHSFDNVLIWGVLGHMLPDVHQRVGDSMLEAWIKFVNGEDPWERFN